MDDVVNRFARELADAIAAAVAENSQVEACREKARAAGFEMKVTLEAVVGFPLEWSGGAFAPGETSVDHPWAKTVRGALSDELGREAPLAGVPWGADMRLFTARGIPTVMVGMGSSP